MQKEKVKVNISKIVIGQHADFDGPLNEAKFRWLAGLCVKCGKSRSEPDSDLCEPCFKDQEIAAMERRWRLWGIAA